MANMEYVPEFKENKTTVVREMVYDQDNLFDMETGIYGNGVALEEYKEASGLVDRKFRKATKTRMEILIICLPMLIGLGKNGKLS